MILLPPPPPPPPGPPPPPSSFGVNQLFIAGEKQNQILDNKSRLLDDIRNGVKLKKCETIEKGLLNGNHHHHQNGGAPQVRFRFGIFITGFFFWLVCV